MFFFVFFLLSWDEKLSVLCDERKKLLYVVSMERGAMPRSGGANGDDGAGTKVEDDTWQGGYEKNQAHTALHEENNEHDDRQRLLVNTARRSSDVSDIRCTRSDDADEEDNDDDEEEKASGGVGAIWLTFFSSALVGTQLAWALQVRQRIYAHTHTHTHKSF